MAPVHTWYATSRFDLVGSPVGRLSDDLFIMHAKRIGTTRSACGQNTLNWHKYWRDFASVHPARACPACVRAVALARPPAGVGRTMESDEMFD